MSHRIVILLIIALLIRKELVGLAWTVDMDKVVARHAIEDLEKRLKNITGKN